MTIPDFTALEIGMELPKKLYKPDNVQLFLYNAALWNAHRIHFDSPYATEVEGYPGLVIAGPLLGEWLGQCVEEWMGDAGRLVKLAYSNRRAAYVGETLRAGGRITSLDADANEAGLDVFIKNEKGEVVTPGTARVRFHK